MPNPYDNLFGNDPPLAFGAKQPAVPEPAAPVAPQPEPLDEILHKNAQFHQQAQVFSTLLSNLRAVDHQVPNELLAIFVKMGNDHDQGSLAGEKDYHALLSKKFCLIMEPMRELAGLHLAAVKQFNNDIDEGYFSVEKEDGEVKSEKNAAVEGILLQRRILAEATDHLLILEAALEACERRLKKYVNVGGSNNLSASELALLAANRNRLTNGEEHGFDHRFFNTNLLDKAAISLGIYVKETTSQYLQKLATALQAKT